MLTRHSWLAHVIQSFVGVQNVVHAHLCYERRLLDLESPASRPSLPDIGGQSFLITDPNPPIRSADIYTTLQTLALTPVNFQHIPPISTFPLAHVVEWYDVLQFHVPVLPKLPFPLFVLQPALFAVSDVHLVIDDRRAREKPERGGLGYDAPYDSMTLLCFQVLQWNLNVERAREKVNGEVQAAPERMLEQVAPAVQLEA